MLQSDLYKLLCDTGLEVYYYNADEATGLPYVIYYIDKCEARGSDERNEIKKDSYIVEFYSNKKDIINQSKIEKVLDDSGIKYTTNESYLDTESMYMVAFYFEIIRKVR